MISLLSLHDNLMHALIYNLHTYDQFQLQTDKMTDERCSVSDIVRRFMVKLHTSNIQMTYEYIRVTYG